MLRQFTDCSRHDSVRLILLGKIEGPGLILLQINGELGAESVLRHALTII